MADFGKAVMSVVSLWLSDCRQQDHGGNLRAIIAALVCDIVVWIDLSTRINAGA
jgi:hypothetical protein